MPSDLQNFVDILQQDLTTLTALESLLAEERKILEQNEVNALPGLASQKTPLLKRLEDHAIARANWIKSCKLPQAKVLELLRSKAPLAMKLYGQCQQKLKHIQQMNEINGRVIATSQQRVEKLMTIIRGQGAKTSIYGKNGSQRPISGHHYLTTA